MSTFEAALIGLTIGIVFGLVNGVLERNRRLP
jgi:ribose/xylose/arabinose/galactoside ABC-type transport system permease subunit